ncbi:hypothetical protein ACHAXT_004676 [Thalassiosira profunda]
MPLRTWLDPPAPPITGEVWNATNIRWIGKSFYFANRGKGGDKVSNAQQQHLYTPHQIQKAFRHHSILFQGDSTVRRLYGTLHGILSYDVWTGSTSADFPKGFPAQVPNPPFGTPATYFVRRGYEVRAKDVNPKTLLSLVTHSPAPIDPRLLDHEKVVDVNKDFYTEPCDRSFPTSHVMHSPSGWAFKADQMEYKVCRKYPTGGWKLPAMESRSSQQRHAKLLYDYVNTNCLGHINEFVNHELAHQEAITRQYTLYVVGAGVWETVKQAACSHPLYEKLQSTSGRKLQWPETVYNLLRDTLEKLAMLAEQSPQLLIVWRTSGFYDGDAHSHVIREMNRRAVDFIGAWNKKHRLLRNAKRSNFLCMDFGAAVEYQSHGEARLRGDMQAHYGLEVRILQAQMLANLLYESGHVVR